MESELSYAMKKNYSCFKWPLLYLSVRYTVNAFGYRLTFG